MNTTRRTVRYTVGWTITGADEAAIAKLPETAWETSLRPDGSLQDGYWVAELTGCNTRAGWPEGMRLIVRRVRPTRRHPGPRRCGRRLGVVDRLGTGDQVLAAVDGA